MSVVGEMYGLIAPENGGIYFLVSSPPGGTPAAKIGFSSKSIATRIGGLRTAHPWPLTLVAFISGATRAVEREYHARFRHLRISASPGREWFRFESDLLECVDQLRSRGCRESFNVWLSRQRGRDDMVGDLADDNESRPLRTIRDFAALRAEMSRVTRDHLVREAAMHAWYEYRKGRPSPAMRECAYVLATAIAGSNPDACVWTKAGVFKNGERLW